MPLLSVVIPTYKRNDLLIKCLDQLTSQKQGLSIDLYEVIVTDDALTDNSKNIIDEHYPWVKWSQGPQKGPATNRNNGAKMARGGWLIFTDDDCIPDEGMITSYLQAIKENPNLSAFEGKTISDREQERYDEEAPINVTGNNFWSCNICVKKDVFSSIGGFDENFPFPAMEDVDLQVRLERNGWAIKFIDSAIVIHPWRAKRGWTGYMNNMKSTLYFNQKHKAYVANSRAMYFKIFMVGFPKRFSRLSTFKYRGLTDFVQENAFYLMLAVKFFFSYSQKANANN